MLLLWDIDGTLVARASRSHAAALRPAAMEVFGIELDAARVVEVAGRTDGAIARDLLVAHGVSDEEINEYSDALREAWCRQYEETCEQDLSHTVVPGIPRLLDELSALGTVRHALLTGNLEPIARTKLTRAGLVGRFDPWLGAFGSDDEQRPALPAIARRRAGDGNGEWPRERTIVIGDTPRDIECARADGLRVFAVTTGPFDSGTLAEADVVVSGPDELRPLLLEALSARFS